MIAPSFALVGYAFALGAAIGIAGGWKVKGWQEDAAKLESERAAVEEIEDWRKRADKIATMWAENDGRLRTEHRARVAALRRELESARVYRDPDCAMPDSGRVLLDAAIDSANAARRPGAAVPGAAETGRADGGRPASP